VKIQLSITTLLTELEYIVFETADEYVSLILNTTLEIRAFSPICKIEPVDTVVLPVLRFTTEL
jgi:hypothetical protein